MLNRGAIILKYREPAIRWINEADPDDAGHEITATDRDGIGRLVHNRVAVAKAKVSESFSRVV